MRSSNEGPSGRVVVVTGAGTGIGRATARAFAAEGALVTAVGRRVEPLRETAAGSGRITPLVADISSPVAADAHAARPHRAPGRGGVDDHPAGGAGSIVRHGGCAPGRRGSGRGL